MIILRKIAQPQAQEIYRNGTIVADTISGTLNGVNKIFYTTYKYRADRIDLHYNGQALHAPNDFEQTGDREITLIYDAPLPDENLRATYELDTATYDPSYRSRVGIVIGAVSKEVIFSSPQPDLSYNVSVDLVSEDSNPSVYGWIVAQKTVNGFTVFFSGEIDSNNYFLEYEILN